MEKLVFVPQKSKSEQFKLIKRARKGDKEAKDTLVLSCMGLVYKKITYLINTQGQGCYLPYNAYEDLINTGLSGILYAYEKFDLSRKTAFSSYAYFWISKYLNKQFNKIVKTCLPKFQNALEDIPVEEPEFDTVFNKILCRQLLLTIPSFERYIIMLNFGIDCRCHTLTEIAKRYRYSYQYVYKIKKNALEQMRKNSENVLQYV